MQLYKFIMGGISIHAPTRGATILRFPCRDRGYNFNPRSYKRSDVSRSILPRHTENFNPRSYKRSDCSVMRKCSAPCYFNPRSYKRSDEYPITSPTFLIYFNPRSYKRSDFYLYFIINNTIISIHAPTRGATAKMHNIPYASLQ